MRVAACQMRSGDDVSENVAAARLLLAEATGGGADLAVLPELFPSLAEARAPELAEPLPGGPVGEMLSAAAREGDMWVLGGSLYERDGDRLFNTSPLYDRTGELVARYRKIHLFDVDLEGQAPFRESATVSPGNEIVSHVIDDVRAGLAICYDLRFPELFRGLMAVGSEVFLLPSQFQYRTGVAHWAVLLRARAIENQCFVVAAAQWGAFGRPGDGHLSYGNSMIVGPWGDVLAAAPEEGTGVWFADLDLTELRHVRKTLRALEHRRLGLSC